MTEPNLKEFYREYFSCVNLNFFINNTLSAYLSYMHNKKGKNNLRDYRDQINELLTHTQIDNKKFNNIMDAFIDRNLKSQDKKDLTFKQTKRILTKKKKKRGNYPVTTYLNNYKKLLIKNLEEIPKSLNKTRQLLLELIDAYNTRCYSDQVYDAIIVLKREIPTQKVLDIIEEWKKEAVSHVRSGRTSKIFWNSDVENRFEDIVSRYRLIKHFNIKEFEFVLDDIKSAFEESILETRSSSLGSYDLWLVSRSQELALDIAGISLKLRFFKQSQNDLYQTIGK